MNQAIYFVEILFSLQGFFCKSKVNYLKKYLLTVLEVINESNFALWPWTANKVTMCRLF